MCNLSPLAWLMLVGAISVIVVGAVSISQIMYALNAYWRALDDSASFDSSDN